MKAIIPGASLTDRDKQKTAEINARFNPFDVEF